MPEEEVVVVKKPHAPRKRAAAASAADLGVPARAPRRMVAKKTSSSTSSPRKRKAVIETKESEVISSPTAQVRKAPTPLATERLDKKTKKKHLIIATVLLLSGVGASAAVGFTDSGKIDVNQTIQARNDRIMSAGEEAAGETIVPVQTTTLPNGGMRGRGIGTRNVATTTETVATTTEETATTTVETASTSEIATE